MAELTSSELPVGYTSPITANQMNRLIDDLLKHHDHSGSKGAAILHSDLNDDEAIPETYLTHSLINKHVQGSGTASDPDQTASGGGGDVGIHGLGLSDYLFGSYHRQMVAEYGTGTTNNERQLDGDEYEKRGRGTFSTPFAEPPYVICVATETEAMRTSVYQVLTTSFAVKLCPIAESSTFGGTGQHINFNWIAIGVPSE